MITEEDVMELLSQGYSHEDIERVIMEDENSNYNPLLKSYNSNYNQNQQMQMQDPRNMASNSMFSSPENNNMIIWQLELDNILERMEHILRGDTIKFVNGQVIWVSPKTEIERKMIVLNDYGVSEIMRILANYLNRNTILSNYNQNDINEICFDIGCEINNLVYMKYENMGMDSYEKRKSYPILVKDIVNQIRNAYNRALMGGERTSLREARQVMQNDTLVGGQGININMPMGGKERGVLNPLRYLKGKFA